MPELTPEREAEIREIAYSFGSAASFGVPELLAEIDRLRAELAACRAATIEECAKIAEGERLAGLDELGWIEVQNRTCEIIARSIRALAPPEAAT